MVHRSTSRMSLSLLLRQYLACLVRQTLIVFIMGGRWLYSWALLGVAFRIYSKLLAAFLCLSINRGNICLDLILFQFFFLHPTYFLLFFFFFLLMSTVFTNGLGDRGSIPGWVIPKTQKMVLDATLFNTQHHKVSIKGSGAIQEME